MGGSKDRDARRKQDFGSAPAVTSSLADKLRQKGLVPAAPPPEEPAPAAAEPPQESIEKPDKSSAKPKDNSISNPSPAPTGPLAALPKVVLRMERKGHGGKTVTVVDGVSALGERALDELARRLGKGLGCGARAEGGAVVVQGDQRERAVPLLLKEGARKVIRG